MIWENSFQDLKIILKFKLPDLENLKGLDVAGNEVVFGTKGQAWNLSLDPGGAGNNLTVEKNQHKNRNFHFGFECKFKKISGHFDFCHENESWAVSWGEIIWLSWDKTERVEWQKSGTAPKRPEKDPKMSNSVNKKMASKLLAKIIAFIPLGYQQNSISSS